MAVAVIFLVRRFLAFQVDFTELFTARTMPSLILVTVAIMATLLLGSICWKTWLSFFSNKKVPVWATYSVYAKSNLAKYLPSNVVHYAMRQLYGTSLGIKQKELLFSSVLEIFCMALTALILSLALAKDVFIQFVSDSFQRAWLLPVLIIVVAALVVGAILFLRKKNISASEILSYLKQKAFRLSLIFVICLIACNLTIYGTTLLILLSPSVDIGTYGLLIISSGIVSWFIGFITPGVPGGIGVREAVMLLMLSPVIPDDIIIFAAVVQRLAFIFSDVVSWVIGKAIETKTIQDASS